MTATATTCPLCDRRELVTDAERAMTACTECATSLGIVPMAPARRPPLPCARCRQMVFVRVIPREHSTDARGKRGTQLSAPMFATHIPDVYKVPWVSHVQPIAIEAHGVGLLELYICRGCGFTEWYCADVEKIPIHPHLMTEMIDYGASSDGPYR